MHRSPLLGMKAGLRLCRWWTGRRAHYALSRVLLKSSADEERQDPMGTLSRSSSRGCGT